VTRQTIMKKLDIVKDSAQDKKLSKALVFAVSSRRLMKEKHGHYRLPLESEKVDPFEGAAVSAHVLPGGTEQDAI
jgi:hypothetical protein